MAGLFDILAEYWPRYLSGAWLTIQLVVISALLGLLLAVPVALARLSRNPAVRGAARSPPLPGISSPAAFPPGPAGCTGVTWTTPCASV